MKVTLKARAP
jgi:hypothetical protein